MIVLEIILYYFNPRLREGGDILPNPASDILPDFNPRLREGGDADAPNAVLTQIFISIHASAREATSIRYSKIVHDRNFNPRLREGGDALRVVKRFSASHFNPRLREGGDL